MNQFKLTEIKSWLVCQSLQRFTIEIGQVERK